MSKKHFLVVVDADYVIGSEIIDAKKHPELLCDEGVDEDVERELIRFGESPRIGLYSDVVLSSTFAQSKEEAIEKVAKE